MATEKPNGYYNWRKSANGTYSKEHPLSQTFPTSVREKYGRAHITLQEPLGMRFDVILNRETAERLVQQLQEVIPKLPKSELPF